MTKYSVIVVGGGHAGVEAAHIAAKMGCKTLLITLNFNKVANMPCNPSIGGSAKGIVVREIDALGGLMGKAADVNYLQLKMLNTGKGPGVQCLRAQQDKLAYPERVLEMLKNTANLDLIEGMVTELILDNNVVAGVKLKTGEEIKGDSVILTTGTYMESDILVGHEKVMAGPDGEEPSLGLSPFLRDKMGIDLIRLKTGTPQRIKKSSIDFSKMHEELGTDDELAFSYETTEYVPFNKQLPCYLIYTEPTTHQIIRDNLMLSAMYSGLVEGVGPRYCPSIEDKIVRFADKQRHQLFLEPESRLTDSYYLQGFSTSMPREVQLKMVHSLLGLEDAIILKYAYAIEYDAIDPLQFDKTLMLKSYPGLYIAGQICGTSGYEEAGGLGLVAGINAVLRLRKEEPFIMGRDESYIGVMIDDIVNKGIKDPYRLLSSRAEFRLLLRSDNADIRLRKYAHKFATISDELYTKFLEKEKIESDLITYLSATHIGENEALDKYYKEINNGETYRRGVTIADIIKHPDSELLKVFACFPNLSNLNLSRLILRQVEIAVKYEGYIKKQKSDADKLLKLENIKLPEDLDYLHIDGLALEARTKLDKIKPISIGQASRISGINPSDITILNLYLSKKRAGKVK
ncbi:MAG: tRNA uridine-5-carboxymethylaminomethyl(34) synthesis enzyme MnmG [Bacilli bacterium]